MTRSGPKAVLHAVPAAPAAIPRRRRDLVTDRVVAFDAARGVTTLSPKRHLKRPPLEQVHVWRRLQLLQDYLERHGHHRPPVVWIRETLGQRLARIHRRRAAAKALQDAGCVALEGSISR